MVVVVGGAFNAPHPLYRNRFKSKVLTCVFIKLTGGVHLKVDKFAASQRNHHLALVYRALHNGLFARRFPFIDSLVRSRI